MKSLSPKVLATVGIVAASALWGASFVTQKIAGYHMGSFTYNGIRFLLGALSLCPVILALERKALSADSPTEQTKPSPAIIRRTWLAGLGGGVIIFIAANLQQFGIVLSRSPSSASEAGFITGLYTIFVPVFGLALGRKAGLPVWLGAALAFAGLAMISIGSAGDAGPGVLASVQPSDLLLVLCAMVWAVHILYIDKFAQSVSPVRFTAAKFTVSGILSVICALVFEDVSVRGLMDGAMPLLYGGIAASGIAYTLQVLGQRRVAPSRAAIIFSLESLFAAVSEAVFLGVAMTAQKYAGGAVILSGILLSQHKKRDKGGGSVL